jgi:uncharacterized RDD family membrane protein YckC
MEGSSTQQLGSRQFCSECGRPYAPEDLVHFGSSAVCAECKPNYVQRMREGVIAANPNAFVYAGFWRRFVAVIVDSILLGIVLLPMRWGMTILGMPSGIGGRFGYDPLTLFASAFWQWGTLLSFVVEITYSVYFISQKGATIGKMLMGVKVVTVSGGPVSVGRAIGRYFARSLSGLILGIGYIMAAFDDQKRALHDHICNTRVIVT